MRAGIGEYREKLRPSGRASMVMWWSHTRASVLQAQLAELLPPADSNVW